MKLINLKHQKTWRKRQGLCTHKNLNFLEGFCVPYTWGQFVHTSEMNTSYNASSCSNDVEPWSGGCNDIAVRFFLCQLNSLLLFKNQEAVELCCSLLSVRVSTQLKQTDRLSSSFSESSLKWKEELNENNLHHEVVILKGYYFWILKKVYCIFCWGLGVDFWTVPGCFSH